jgi:hypothetical protein
VFIIYFKLGNKYLKLKKNNLNRQNLARMQTSGDEMELFAAVNRKFRHLFAQQEHMKSFKTYDSDLVFINCTIIRFSPFKNYIIF